MLVGRVLEGGVTLEAMVEMGVTLGSIYRIIKAGVLGGLISEMLLGILFTQ